MEKITITIPDNLSPEQETLLIAQELGKKLLPGGKSGKQKLLGTGYEIKQLQTEIKIIREPVEKPIVTFDCNCCGAIFEPSFGQKAWTNYGGKTRRITYCSTECHDNVIEIAGAGRIAIKKSDLTKFIP